MHFVQLTRMVEKKSKGGDRGDLTGIGYAAAGPVWVQPGNVVAMTATKAPISVTEDQTEFGTVTELLLVGVADPLYVQEDVQDVIAKVMEGAAE